MNNLKNLKKNIASFLIITWFFLLISLWILSFYEGSIQADSSYLLGDLKVLLCGVFLFPPFMVYSIFLCIDLYQINKDLKSLCINKTTITITKVSNRQTFLMFNGTTDKRLDYQTETYIRVWGHTLDKKKLKIIIFPDVFDSKANICGRRYEVEYYQNSKIATKMTRIKNNVG